MTTPAKKDPKEEGPRSFAVFLQHLADGEAEGELSQQLHDVCKRMQEEAITRGSTVKGALTFSLRMATDPGGHVAIGYDVAIKVPKRKTSASIQWLTKGGNLSPSNPRQQMLPLRDVPMVAAAAEVPDDDAEEAREA